ncbi:phosphatidylinositol synthase [Chloropicon primus]|nr:phosphatidylinositol synthase [Chloropicon primus]
MDGGYSPGQNTASTLQVAMNSENLASSRDSVNTSGFSKPHGHKYAMNKLSDNWFLERHRFIPVYIPNIIGYLRIICTTISIALAFTHPRSMLFFYFISFVFDELDGRFARLFSQQSTFGAVLDMVTDRLSTAALLCILGVLYPGMAQIFILLQALDIASHWCHMYASLLSGGTSHKELSNHHNWLVRSYYANRIFMGTCCVSCELLYLSIYALHWPMDFKDWSVPLGPAWASWASVVQGEGQREVSIFVLFALVAIPGFVIKNLVNVIQLVQSMKGLCEHDLKNM